VFRDQIVPVFLTAGVVFLVIAIARWNGMLQSLELQAYDVLLRARALDPPAEQRITIISAGEEEVERFGWPLPDEILADLLDRLVDLEPEVVGVDIYRDRPVGDGGERLAEQLATHDNIFWISKFGDAASVGVAAPAALVDTERTGFADITVDPGGTVRRGVLFLDDGVNIDFSFSLRLALYHLESRNVSPEPGEPDPSHMKIGATTIPPFEANDGSYVRADARGYQYLLDYKYGPPSFPTIGLGEVLDDKFSAELIQGKIVLVGVMSETVKDFFYTPFSRNSGQTTFGVEMHGEMTNQVIRHALEASPVTRSLTEGQEAGWILFWTLLGALVAGWVRSPLWFVLALTTGVASLTGVAYAAFVASWWLPLVPAALGAAGSAGLGASYMSYRERRERARLMGLFSRHVSGAVAEEIWHHRDEFLDQGRPKPRSLQATVLFVDIKGFTRIAETLEPAVLIDWLNDYLEAMVRIVAAHNGVVDKFMGDAVMAVFGVPIPCRDANSIAEQARNAATCALAMARELKRLNTELRAAELPSIAVRIGIHTGDLIAGSLGSSERSEYTVIGDTVNTASRLESFANELAESETNPTLCTIAISGAMLKWLDAGFATREIGEVQLKGKAERVSVYHLMDFAEPSGKAGDE
jgi:adenylate cyclase